VKRRDARIAPRIGLRALRDPASALALGLGAGLSPIAPGTVGSLVALVPGWLFLQLELPVRALVVAAVVAAGIVICGAAARRLGVHDHPAIVFDEVAGMLLTLLPASGAAWWHLALGFVLFRIFDIAKPWPIRDIDHRLHGGLGIMLDDVMAAVYAAALLTAIQVLLPT
jgi:phosphatidylglycerophosphatase A